MLHEEFDSNLLHPSLKNTELFRVLTLNLKEGTSVFGPSGTQITFTTEVEIFRSLQAFNNWGVEELPEEFTTLCRENPGGVICAMMKHKEDDPITLEHIESHPVKISGFPNIFPMVIRVLAPHITAKEIIAFLRMADRYYPKNSECDYTELITNVLVCIPTSHNALLRHRITHLDTIKSSLTIRKFLDHVYRNFLGDNPQGQAKSEGIETFEHEFEKIPAKFLNIPLHFSLEISEKSHLDLTAPRLTVREHVLYCILTYAERISSLEKSLLRIISREMSDMGDNFEELLFGSTTDPKLSARVINILIQLTPTFEVLLERKMQWSSIDPCGPEHEGPTNIPALVKFYYQQTRG